MSMNLIHTNRAAPSKAAEDWAAIIAVSSADAGSPYPNEGYVAVSPEAVVALAALLEGAGLANGQNVTTYDFSFVDGDTSHLEAHVNAFGPSLLDDARMAAVRVILAPFPSAIALLDVVVARGLQVSLSTQDAFGAHAPSMTGVNWPADDAGIRLSGSGMLRMLREIGLVVPTAESGETDFETFARAVNDNGLNTDYPVERLNAFVACGRRHGATHVHWA